MEWDDASWKLCILLVCLDRPCLLNGGGWEQQELPRVSGRTVSARLENSSNGGFDCWDFCLGELSVVCGEFIELSFVLNLSTTVVGIMTIIHDKLSDKLILAWQDSRG